MIWVEFCGEGRSGHTVLSGALGSNPHVRISEEQKYISKYLRGYTQQEILVLLGQSGVGRARQAQGWYNLQSFTEPLQVIGDKCGWAAVNEVKKRDAPTSIINDFSQHMGMPVRTLVTIRHPLDNISSWASGNKYKRMYSDVPLRFRRLVRRYKQFYDTALDILQETDYMIVNHEELIAHPSETLQIISDYLELSANRPWRRASAKRIWNKPRLRRHEVDWPQASLDNISKFIDEHPLMEYYRES